MGNQVENDNNNKILSNNIIKETIESSSISQSKILINEKESEYPSIIDTNPNLKFNLVNKSIIKKAEYNKNYNKTYKRTKKIDDSYEQLQAQLAKDSMELSSSSRYISDYDFSKWNLSFYHRNKKGNLVLISGIIAGFDVPRTVNMNVKVPTQRHKHKCCMSY